MKQPGQIEHPPAGRLLSEQSDLAPQSRSLGDVGKYRKNVGKTRRAGDDLSSADWIELIREARLTFGSAAAQQLWHESSLPKILSDLSSIRQFVQECVERTDADVVGVSYIHQQYSQWCAMRDQTPASSRDFGRALNQLGFVKFKSSLMYWRGVRIRAGSGQ